jgi:hypothetical protein
MATWDDVRVRALALPETDEIDRRGQLTWRVKEKGFVWERPLNKSDIKRQEAAGAPIPDGPILAARVDDEGVKGGLIASAPDVYFTIAHFDGYSAVLVLLERISPEELDELIIDAWLACAPAKLAKQFFG